MKMTSQAACLMVAGVAMLCAWPPAHAQTAQEIRRGQVGILRLYVTDHPAESVADERRFCVLGREPDATQKSRAIGANLVPDASDSCAALALRMAQDGTLLLPYQELLANATGDSAGYEKLPAAIATTALKGGGTDRLPIGNGKAVVLTPAWVFDAGFTVAYQQRPAAPASMPSLATLKPIAERCLAQQERDLSLCYSTGYIYGLRAVHGTLMAALLQTNP